MGFFRASPVPKALTALAGQALGKADAQNAGAFSRAGYKQNAYSTG